MAARLSSSPSDWLVVALHVYFMLMNVTVERWYCHGPLTKGDKRFLMADTYNFAEKFNPLFLARPEWMRLATCASAYGFLPFYAFTTFTAATASWARARTVLTLFAGAKLYAVLFYHLSEFTSSTPPPSPAVYFGPEGPYLVSIALVLTKVTTAASSAGAARPKAA